MSFGQASPADEWLNAFVPLGALQDERWSSVGAGVLLVDEPVVWLFTTKSAIAAAGDAPVAGWVPDGKGGTVVDLTTGRGPELGWLLHPTLNLAAFLFPVDPAWQVKAFSEPRCLTRTDAQPMMPAATLGAPYGLGPLTERPKPLVLLGNLASVDGDSLVTTAPLLPRNTGAPLLVPLPAQAGGGVALAGIAVETQAIPEAVQSTAPPVRITNAIGIGAALALIRSKAGKAQRAAALSQSS